MFPSMIIIQWHLRVSFRTDGLVNKHFTRWDVFTGECLDTQCLRTFRTLLVAARLITNSLSPFLWSVGKPAENMSKGFLPWVLVCMIHTTNTYKVRGAWIQNQFALWCLPIKRGGPKYWWNSGQVWIPVLARDIRRYFSLVGVPSLAPAVAMAKAEAADRALRLLSSSRQEDITMPLL